MRASAACLVVLSVATTFVSSHPSTESYLTRSFRVLSSPSYKRQSSTVPPQCTSICDPVNDEVNDGCPMTTCCTQSFETSYYDCLLCAQSDLDGLYVSCSDYGYSLQELTLPGQNPSRTLLTSSSTRTSTDGGTSPSPTSVSSPTSLSVPTSIQTTTILSSSTSLGSSGTSTSGNGTATSSASEPTTSSAALGLSTGGSGILALFATAVGLIVLRNS
ncbi:uncharacterized protein F5891DRAFT_1021356 [Suillus fuscotomentosus]|uniref:Uncharacterized protein n=1 Tax=Suillus fuscotomentosus TaxID=1912939 RepID=A0AAD4EAQ9_9AGAM|nr:uncharacterized protein F5891DRAFT_1021356 [Suillus fuscotomentosus]KAG1902828.1 hypothetical protein F5891DRAFT_1021356 [Suillus fuscotomentosus]